MNALNVWRSGALLSTSEPNPLPFHRSPNAIDAFTAATGMSFGAFGSHGLRARFPSLPEGSQNSWSTASSYLIYNGLALLAVSNHPRITSGIRKNRWATAMILVGALTFSGTIFGLVLAREKVGKVFGPLTPIGGLVMIAG